MGMLLDRWGAKRLIIGGTIVMAAGQLVLGVVDTLPPTFIARAFIGLGDAAVLVSLLRLIPLWFRPRVVPVITQMTGILGQLGQIVSAVPFLAVLLSFGWTAAFGSLAMVGLLIALVAALTVRDRPPARPEGDDSNSGQGSASPSLAAPESAPGGLRSVLTTPGVWLGFFTHFVTLFPSNTFLFLWGVPFLTAGQGVSPARASAVLTIGTVAGIIAGPVMGELTARFPERRSWLVLGTVAASTVIWGAVLIPSTPRPFWLLALLGVVVTIGVVACTIGFDYARTFIPGPQLGTAIGVVNVGGYFASLVSILIVGVVLDAVRPSGEYVLGDFRLAFAALTPLLLIGMTGLLLARRASRARE